VIAGKEYGSGISRDSVESLGLTGFGAFSVSGLDQGLTSRQAAPVSVVRPDKSVLELDTTDPNRCGHRSGVLPEWWDSADDSARVVVGMNRERDCHVQICYQGIR
jgi:hypothetical protein